MNEGFGPKTPGQMRNAMTVAVNLLFWEIPAKNAKGEWKQEARNEIWRIAREKSEKVDR